MSVDGSAALPLQLDGCPPPPGAGELLALMDHAPQLLQAVLDAIPARVIVLDAGEHLVYANNGFFAFTQLHPKQVLGRHISQVIGEATHATYAPVRERLWRGETVCWEGWTALAGVGRRYMREHLVPCGVAAPPAPPAPPRATVVMSLDLTDLKLREGELSERLAQLQGTRALKSSIVDHALAALVSTDAAGRIVEFNPAAEQMFGVARAQVLGREVADVIVPPRYREAHVAGMARMAAGEPARIMGQRMEMSALRANGSEFPVEMVLWRTEAEGRVHYTASLVDLTERHNARREIERQREALRQSEKMGAMGSLLAGVAHELNNPLAIVLGRAALLEEKAADAPALQADARRIREAAERCGRIVRTFLNMARQKPVELAPVQLNDLARAAAEILAYSLRSHGIVLGLALADGLPMVMADGDQLGQVVLNLLVNAQQALALVPQGARSVTLSTGVETRREGSGAREPRVWLRVADSGPGVREDLRDKLFEPFFTTKPEGSGTGLGLAVSRAIAKEHGGDLVLERGETGASFRMSLPISGQAEARDSAPAPLAPVQPAAARVLVVDDEPEIAELMREMLEGAGYEVASAESGAVALALLDEARFDAVVSDLHMPDVDGAALWREVRRLRPALARRMLFVTGDTLSPSARQFLDSTRCPSLNKPFSKAELLGQLHALLEEAAPPPAP